MASTHNTCEPIGVERNEAVEAQSQKHSRIQQLPLPTSQIDQHRAGTTEAFPSIDISTPSTTTDHLRQHGSLSLVEQNLSNSPTNFSQDTSLNLYFQDIWEESMEGVGSTAAPHKKTAVLMISWAGILDELDTGPEVKELAGVFRNHFNYEVVEVELTAGTLPKNQLSVYLAQFIADFDTESTLLIIYYAGHGIRGRPGELYFASKKTDKPRSDEKNSIPWHKIEAQLRIAEGDILLIFDCCYAGNLDMHFDGRGHWASRSFELLAACKHDEKTHPPGPKSFTKALIWALKSLLGKRQKFSTHELQMKIQHANGFPSHQGVRIIDRGDPSDHRLVLAAIPDSVSSETESMRPKAPRPKNFIDLRFWYTECPDQDEVKELSSRIKQLIHNEHIKTDRVGWTRLGNINQDQVKNVLEKWRGLPGLRLRQSTTTLSPLVIPQSSPRVHLQPPYTPPPSNSGNSSISDAHIQADDIFSPSANVPPTFKVNMGAKEKVILEANETGVDDAKNDKYHLSAFSNDLDRKINGLPHIVSLNIHTSHTTTVLSVASLSFLVSFGLCKYLFDRK